MTLTRQDEARAERHERRTQCSSSSAPTDQMPKTAPPRKTNLQKELGSLLIDSKRFLSPAVPKGLDASEHYMTRHKTKTLQGIFEKPTGLDPNECGQFNVEPEEVVDISVVCPKRGKAAPKAKTVVETSDPPNAAALKRILKEKRAAGLIKWRAWQERKAKITDVLQSRHYSISSNVSDLMAVGTDSKGLNLTIEDGLHVFRPTANVIHDFEKFLLKVEDIAGRETGVVKVILPEELVSSFDPSTEFCNQPVPSHDQKALGPSVENPWVVAQLTKLDLRVSELQYLPMYDVHMMGGLRMRISTCLEGVRKHSRSVLKRYKNEKYRGNIFSDVKFVKKYYDEEKMVECGAHQSDDRYYSSDIEANNENRNALRCGKLKMKEFYSHGLKGAETDRDKIHQPKFQIAGAFGSSFGLQMTSFGAYSLNVLRSGAPKCWTVIKPADHQKIELEFLPDAEEASQRGRRIKYIRLDHVHGDYTDDQKQLESLPCDLPPRCDQFLNHQPFYVPNGSLKTCQVGFTRFFQYKGELVITFPFAYYQGYSCGPSIAEQVGYTNERSERLNREGLYHHCHTACTGPKLPVDFDAFPTAAALDARRKEKTIVPQIPNVTVTYEGKYPTSGLHTMMEISTKENTKKSESKDAADPMLGFKSSDRAEEKASENTKGSLTGNKGSTRRRRLVKASDL